MIPPGRAEPMNAVSRHSKVKVSLKFADHQFVSGENVAGRMELECKTDNGLAIGIIKVEFLAFEGECQISVYISDVLSLERD
jgi:hypothetical protein